MSPVTCHLSPVICHLSPVTCHMSPVTCHMSPFTCHLLPVTCHVLPVTCHLHQLPQPETLPQLTSPLWTVVWLTETKKPENMSNCKNKQILKRQSSKTSRGMPILAKYSSTKIPLLQTQTGVTNNYARGDGRTLRLLD